MRWLLININLSELFWAKKLRKVEIELDSEPRLEIGSVTNNFPSV